VAFFPDSHAQSEYRLVATKRTRLNRRSLKIAVIGLGYVGLPLAVEFGKRFRTTGFDVKSSRIQALERGHDATLEVTSDELASAKNLTFTTRIDDLAACKVFIRHGADTDRRVQTTGPHAPREGKRHDREGTQERRCGRL
jgi:hypothetical protein